MKRLERLTIQVSEAIRFLDIGREPHLRLALELADGACEALLQAACEHHIALDRWLQAEISPKRRREIDRDYNEKVRFLQEKDDLGADEGRVLCRLHIYRNEVHHRDIVRTKTLDSAARLLVYLAAELIEHDRPIVTQIVSRDGVPDLAPYLSDDTELVPTTEGVRERIASDLKRRSGLDTIADLATALSEHSKDRIVGTVRDLGTVATFLGHDSDPWHALALIATLARDAEPEESLQDLTKRQRAQLAQTSVNDLVQLDANAAAIATHESVVMAYRAFADFEDQFEPLEIAARNMAAEVHAYHEYQEDLYRGK